MVGFVLLFCVSRLCATNPNTRVSQYGHVSWRVQDGSLNAVPTSLAQTPDGYVWIGTETGLLRFDGVRFVQWSAPGWERFTDPKILCLFVDHDGALWISTPSGLAVWKQGKLTIVPLGSELGQINTMVEDHKGRMWGTFDGSLADKPLCELSFKRAICYGLEHGMTQVLAGTLTVAPDDSLLIAGWGSLLQWSPERGRMAEYMYSGSRSSPTGAATANALQWRPDGSLLIALNASGNGLGLKSLKNGMLAPYNAPGLDGSTVASLSVAGDRTGSLWIGSAADGLYRIVNNRVDHYSTKEGLSGDAVRSILEDQEGNVWVATNAGVDCFHDLKVITWSEHEGLPAGGVNSILATKDGSVFVPVRSTLQIFRDGHFQHIGKAQGLMEQGTVFSMAEAASGNSWIGQGRQLDRYDGKTFRPVTFPDGRPTGIALSLAMDADGSVWARGGEPGKPGLVHVKDGRVDFTPIPNHNVFTKIVADKHSGVWLNGVGRITSYTNGQLRSYFFPRDSGSPTDPLVNDLAVDADGSILGSSRVGIWGIRDGKVQRLGIANGLPCQTATALVFSDRQMLLIRTSCGLIEITPQALSRWWANPAAQVPYQLIDNADGIELSDAYYSPQMSLGPDGRIWMANADSFQVMDPNHLPVNPMPPPVHVEEAFVDHTWFESIAGVELPALTRDLEIRYTALSFSVPQKVRFRYMLENRDHAWQDAGSRRTAFYQDLKPGRYRFHVVAANNDGIWNQSGDSVEFSVKAAWFQTLWFRALWITALCLLIWVLYHLRVRSIARAISARFDERLDERTRMALELHDTFLQTVQGSKMVADDALDPSADQVRMRHALERLSLWLEQAVTEGRAALHALRVSTTERNHLAEFLDRTAKEHCQRQSISVALTVIGDAKDLHPIVRDEIARIAEEAIRNACLHSRASQLSIELRYANDLSLSFKDNGVGIDPDVVETGKAGHFGIQGMKDRSARIGARITITSTLKAGTAITLRVPGSVIYRGETKSLLAKLRTGKLWPDRKANQRHTPRENHDGDGK